MARELAFVLINPHTLAKSRTGGVIARYLARTDLSFVAARMLNPPGELVSRYAEQVRTAQEGDLRLNRLIGDYIAESYSPNPLTGHERRIMLLLFEGEDAVAKIWRVTGSAAARPDCGETVRETYGEYVADEDGHVRYFEPAVLVGPSLERTYRTLRLFKPYCASCPGIVESSSDYPPGEIQNTLVILKPDNFRRPSLRPGSIIDVLSATGLRIVGAKKFRMTVEQALTFYAPVRELLAEKFIDVGADKAAAVLSGAFGFTVTREDVESVCRALGPRFAATQFENIIEFMTGYRPSDLRPEDQKIAGNEECLALVYRGVDAVAKIRDTLGATDPDKARPGSIRREFGSDIMVNAAHASDSTENAEREMDIIRVAEDTVTPWIEQYCG